MAYPTASELKLFKVNGQVIDLSTYSDAEITAEITLATEYVEALCNDWFISKTVTQTYDGHSQYRLFFFPAIPAKCTALTSVQDMDDDGTTILRTYTENTDFKLYDHYIELFRSTNSRASRGIGTSGRWPMGAKNIKVVGTFGHSSTPASINRAITFLALERLKQGSTGITPKDIYQSSWPDFTISFKGGSVLDGSSVGMSTGFPDIDRLLMPYVNMIDIFSVVPEDRQFFDTSPFRRE